MSKGQQSPPPSFLDELYGLKQEEDEEGYEEVEIEVEEIEIEVDEVEIEVEEEVKPMENAEENEPCSPVAPPYSPLSSFRNDCDLSPFSARSRSRSPLVRVPSPELSLNSAGVVIRVCDENDVYLENCVHEDKRLTIIVAPDDDVGYIDRGQEFDEFLTPDAHALYVSTNERMEVGQSGDGDESGVIDDRGALYDGSEREMRARSVRSRTRGGGRVRGRGGRGRGVRGGRRREAEGRWVVGHPLEEIWVTDDDVPLELREMAMDVVRRRMVAKKERSTSDRSTRERRRTDEEDASESENDNFEDAIDGSDNSQFEWSPMETFQIREVIFTPERTGSVASYSSPYDAFRSYWDKSIIHMIVEETNRYAPKIASHSFQSEWYPTNSHEILCLFAFWMMLAIIRMPTIESCFSTHYLLKTEVFRHIMTLRRYRNLVRALHFINSDSSYNAATTSNNDKANSDPIYYLRPIIDHLNAKFQANYVPSQDICIDESLTLWKGRLSFKQYIRSKAAKFGIKTFELCESATGYLWSLLLYTGRDNDFIQHDSTVLKSTAIVKKLTAPLLNKGYRLFMDNWYNSPLLARFLKRNGTECIGTLRSCRRNVPFVIKKAPLKQGQFVARHAGDLCVLAWQDKNRVTMISTCHGTAMGLATISSRPPARPLPFKPQMVLDYNKSMGGVDLKDQMLEPYLLERKRCAKWYMKYFKRLLNVSILNARILLQTSTQAQVDHLDFRLKLVDSLLSIHLPHCPQSRSESAASIRQSRSSYHTPITAPHRLNHTHWPVSIPPNASRAASNRKGRGTCVVCTSENRPKRITPYKCQTCDVPLCVENCFRVYHTS